MANRTKRVTNATAGDIDTNIFANAARSHLLPVTVAAAATLDVNDFTSLMQQQIDAAEFTVAELGSILPSLEPQYDSILPDRAVAAAPSLTYQITNGTGGDVELELFYDSYSTIIRKPVDPAGNPNPKTYPDSSTINDSLYLLVNGATVEVTRVPQATMDLIAATGGLTIAVI